MDSSPNQYTQPMNRHADEALRLIDQALLEESQRLEELKAVVEQNGTEAATAYEAEDIICGWMRRFMDVQ